jgi:hypothetical protein
MAVIRAGWYGFAWSWRAVGVPRPATVDCVFGIAVLIPSPPVLVPEMCGGTPASDPAAGVPALRDAVLAAGRRLAAESARWTIVGVDGADHRLGAEAVGTFRGFGADVRVALSEAALDGAAPADPNLPLAALIGGWLRGRVAPEARARAWTVAAGAAAEACRRRGRALRDEAAADDRPHGVLVIADGAATLSTGAPGYLDERAAGVQEGIDAALAAGDRAALAALDAALCADLEVSGRAAYQVLAGLFDADDRDPAVDTRYCAAPFGVGYQVSVWRPAGRG